jgi:DNA-binding beta-propeller fold protein YncE
MRRPPVHLSYPPGSIGINKALGHLYIANPSAQTIEVLNPSTGKSIATFSLSGVTPDRDMAADSIRGRIYVIQKLSGSTGPMLLVIEDLINAFQPIVFSHIEIGGFIIGATRKALPC